jgi:hypothetical protein
MRPIAATAFAVAVMSLGGCSAPGTAPEAPQGEVQLGLTALKPPLTVVEQLATGPGCIIQSNTRRSLPGRFEVVVLQGHALVHYWHDNSNLNYAWHRERVITPNATSISPGCLIQSDYGATGNLEVVVQEGTRLVHYSHDNTDPTSPWYEAGVVTTAATGGGAIIQSDFGSVEHGNFEVVVQEGANLVHYYRDNSLLTVPWKRARIITTGVTGPGSVIQSHFGSGGHGNFEVVVPKGSELVHYWHDNSNIDLEWQEGRVVARGITGPGSIIQSRFGPSDHGNFEVVVPSGSSLLHFWHDNNSNIDLGWQQGRIVATGITGPGSIIQSNFGPVDHGNFEVVVEGKRAFLQAGAIVAGGRETDQDLLHVWHDNSNLGSEWHPAEAITFRGRSEKVCQLTGDKDRERHTSTTSLTSRFGLETVDLGFPVEGGRQLSFLFGDASSFKHETNLEAPPDDAFGWTGDTLAPTPDQCIHLELNSSPSSLLPGARALVPPVVSPPIPQGLFNVPSSGFWTPQGLYGIFWTDHYNPTSNPSDKHDPAANPIGRAVLTRSTDNGRTFQQLERGRIPRPFVYTASVNTDQLSDLPAEQRVGVLVFGVPCYRQSTPYLASVPTSQVDDVSNWRYFQGTTGGAPTWGDNPIAATPVFDSGTDKLHGSPECIWTNQKPPETGCIREFSVGWISGIQRWVMLYGCDAERGSDLEPGVRLRVAKTPWGPWSDPSTIFSRDNEVGDHGTCHFMHRSGSPACDDLGGDHGDDIGGPYAPFLLSRYSQVGFRGSDGTAGARLFYLLSTWNPYQVVVMKTDILLENSPPAISNVRVVRPGLLGKEVEFSCDASDAEDGTPEVIWTSDKIPLLGTGAHLTRGDLAPGTYRITATAKDSAGLQAAQTVTFVLVNAPPTISIVSPSNGSSHVAGQTLIFQANTFDTETAGPLPSANVVWSSSRDGVLGNGNPLAHGLTQGSHVVTARGTDVDGASTTAQVSVQMAAPPAKDLPPTAFITSIDYNTSQSSPVITLSGVGQDPEDGILSGRSLEWTLESSECTWDVPGGVAFGNTVKAVLTKQVSPGVGHFTIRLTATDSTGYTGTDIREGIINGPPR